MPVCPAVMTNASLSLGMQGQSTVDLALPILACMSAQILLWAATGMTANGGKVCCAATQAVQRQVCCACQRHPGELTAVVWITVLCPRWASSSLWNARREVDGHCMRRQYLQLAWEFTVRCLGYVWAVSALHCSAVWWQRTCAFHSSFDLFNG